MILTKLLPRNLGIMFYFVHLENSSFNIHASLIVVKKKKYTGADAWHDGTFNQEILMNLHDSRRDWPKSKNVIKTL